ncbi:MAG: GntR family transcriptional regulator [Anaerolineales bacterium]
MNTEREDLLSEQAYRQIKRLIVSLELEPGSIVRESELTETLGFGRTPLREALLRLSLEGLVDIIPRQGIFVAQIAISDLQHLFEVRIPLESLAARLAAARGRARHWQQMREALAAISAATEGVSNTDLIRVDEQCHRIMYQATDNEFLERAATTLYSSSLRLWYYFLSEIGDMREAVVEHELILEALAAGDGERAAILIEKHIRAFHREIQAAIGASPSVVGGI